MDLTKPPKPPESLERPNEPSNQQPNQQSNQQPTKLQPPPPLSPFAQHAPYAAPSAYHPHSLAPAVSDSLVTYNHISYALAVFSYFTAGLTWIIPIVMNYLKRDEVRGTWLYSHFDWQIKTFWYSLLFGAIAGVVLFFSVGGFFIGATTNSNGAIGGSVLMGIGGGLMMAGVVLWHLYRIIRGWIALANRHPVP